jgi:hypothetical protein
LTGADILPGVVGGSLGKGVLREQNSPSRSRLPIRLRRFFVRRGVGGGAVIHGGV